MRDDVLLVTFQLLPAGEPGGGLLTEALARRGLRARWVAWDDPAVDWGSARLVAVRSAWDYHRRCAEFLAWARRVGDETLLLNGADVFAWNADKRYLTELAAEGVPVVPTALLDDQDLTTRLAAALAEHGTVVVKPRTGAGGVGLVVAASTEDPRLEGLTAAPWVVQPLVESLRTHGETSVHVLGGRAVAQVDKLPGADVIDEFRVHELYGGRSREATLDPDRAALAEHVVSVAGSRFPEPLAYARVDLVWWAGEWVVSEVEAIEPGLYLDVVPANAERFADLVAQRLC